MGLQCNSFEGRSWSQNRNQIQSHEKFATNEFWSMIVRVLVRGLQKSNSLVKRMKLDLVFVGAPPHACSNLGKFLDQLEVRSRFFESGSELRHLSFEGPDFLVTPFLTNPEFLETKANYRNLGGSPNSVAILSSPDFMHCAEAFRNGVTDVLLSPFSSLDLERMVKRLKSISATHYHPDAILPLDVVERSAIKKAILACNGQVSKTSRALGIGRSTLYRKMEQYELGGSNRQSPR